MTDTNEISVADLRKNLAEILNNAAVHTKTFYVTRNGRRIAAIVPVPVAEQSEQTRGKALLGPWQPSQRGPSPPP